MKGIIAKSLAGTDEKYVVLQARVKGGTIKIQLLGTAQNRDYGYTHEFPTACLPGLAEAIEKVMGEFSV